MGKLHFYDIHPAEGREEFKKNAFDYFALKKPFDRLVNPIVTKTGALRWVETNGLPQVDSRGRLTGYRGIDADVTDRRLYEKKILDAKELLDTVLDNIGAYVYMKDTSYRYTYVNKKTAELFGLPPEDIQGKDDGAFFAKESLQEIMTSDRPVIERGEVVSREETDITAGDEVRRTYFTVKLPLRDKDGKIYALCGISTDVTAQKELERERASLKDQLLQSQKMEAIGTLAGGIAHDFNNLLGAIIGFTELTREALAPGSEESENLKEVLNASTRARELVRQILAFGRRSEKTAAPVNIARVAEETMNLLTNVIPRTVRIFRDIDQASGMVYADATELHQVIMNLCTNAYQAMPDQEGSLELTVGPVSLALRETAGYGLPPGDYVRLMVKDDGEGMAPETLQHIFEPYFTTKEQGKGTGLGLAMVHGIVTGCGGAIKVESMPGKGSVFTVLIPSHHGPEAAVEPTRDETAPPAGRGRILLVDDEPALARLGSKLLQNLGYEVRAETDPLLALKAFTEAPCDFDLIVTDQTMPSMTGMELIAEAKKLKPGIPAVVCTGYSDLIDEQAALEKGIDAFLQKPIQKNALGAAVARALNRGT